MPKLSGRRVAIVANGFEQVELTAPPDALAKDGAETFILSLKGGRVRGFHHQERLRRGSADR